MRAIPFSIMIALALFSASFDASDLTDQVSTASTQMQQQETRPGPAGTIRVHVRLIPVDVVVIRNDGKPVLDLRKEDFTILENGRSQEIRHFSIQRLASEAAPAADQYYYPLLRKVPTLDLTPQSARTFFILLGRGKHLSKSIDALIRFVRSEVLPQDRVAVFAYNRATEFTTDHEKLAQVLERYGKAYGKIEAWCERFFRGTAAVYGEKEIPKSWQSEIDKIFQWPADLASRSLPPIPLSDAERQMAKEALEVADDLLKNEGKQMERQGCRGRGICQSRSKLRQKGGSSQRSAL